MLYYFFIFIKLNYVFSLITLVYLFDILQINSELTGTNVQVAKTSCLKYYFSVEHTPKNIYSILQVIGLQTTLKNNSKYFF